MVAATHELTFKGGVLERGFWLYVWEITTPHGERLYYVGRTGDSSSNNAQSPFNRMAQHLGFKKESNALRRCLEARGVPAEDCSFKVVAYGPILKEGATRDSHRERRDKIAPLEKALAEAMTTAGYDVVNTVNCRIDLDGEMFAVIRAAFASRFSALQHLGRFAERAK
jgi:hypothetical protein